MRTNGVNRLRALHGWPLVLASTSDQPTHPSTHLPTYLSIPVVLPGVGRFAQEARPWWPVGAAFRAPAYGEATQLRPQGCGAGGAGAGVKHCGPKLGGTAHRHVPLLERKPVTDSWHHAGLSLWPPVLTFTLSYCPPLNTLSQFFITADRPNVAGLVLAGSADFKTELSQSDMFDPRLQAVILAVVDVSYGAQGGVWLWWGQWGQWFRH